MRRHKRGYDVMDFMNQQRKWIILVVISGLIGSMLALAKRQYEPLYYSLWHFLTTPVEGGARLGIVKDTMITYGVQLCVIWSCGLFQVTRYVGFAVFVAISSMYSFTATTILLLYGLKGIAIVIGTMGIPMVVMVFMFVYIAQNGSIGGSRRPLKAYCYQLGQCLLIVVGLGVMNGYVQPTIEKVITMVL
ncbi:MAG: hypothetical protein ACRCWY_06465 [Cellulosilyticaceae bacterium]